MIGVIRNLNPGLLRAVDEMGFKMPTPIRADTIPHALPAAMSWLAP
jgi:superfamily II DNA/RNA helicase